MKAILQYQEVKKASNSDSLTCVARYLTDMPMSDCTFSAIQKAFTFKDTKIETVYIDGPTGCWGVEIKAMNRVEPLPLLLE